MRPSRHHRSSSWVAPAEPVQQDVDVLDVLAGELLERLFGDGDLVAGGVCPGVAGAQHAGERLV